jgi:hypothetical protein
MNAQATNKKVGILQLVVEILGLLLIILVVGALIIAALYALTLIGGGG